jgi:orotidine-5'-phosphate decarboxylase
VGLTREQAVKRLVVALDSSDEGRVLELARALRGRAGIVKVGLEAFSVGGPRLVGTLHDLGMPVFLDLKLHDIPNTVEHAAANLARLGVRLFTVHASGGAAMLEAAVRGARAGTPQGTEPPKALAVTVLTSLDDAALEELGVPGGAAARVQAWAKLAAGAGCQGVVCSPQEAAALRAALGPRFILLTPGIRPAGGEIADQRRVATPLAAIRAGADLLVVGRPITATPDPAAAAEEILKQMCV